MTRRVARTCAAAAVLAVACAPASAQGLPGDRVVRPRSIEVAAGAIFAGGVPLGSADAVLTPQPGAPPFTLFRTSSELGAGIGFDGRLAFNLTSVLAVEGGFTWTRPSMRTQISGDAENASAVTLEERIAQYAIDVGAVAHLTGLRPSARAVPFVAAGGGYLRELHEGNILVETGRIFYAGGGLKYFFRLAESFPRDMALRVDARLYVRRRGVDPDDGEPSRTYGAVSGMLAVRF